CVFTGISNTTLNLLSRLALKIIVVMARKQERGTHARVKKFWAILLFLTHFGFSQPTYLKIAGLSENDL
ncbi:hypothetical protein, partial [Dolichospermum sp. UHCC 0260]|uniref:hypothetical protein n=1 Tax=Dolichospermum sp. UHCC 0260 TaxID=2590025 RepID=UPI001C2C1702